jgi:hypothetical protein
MHITIFHPLLHAPGDKAWGKALVPDNSNIRAQHPHILCGKATYCRPREHRLQHETALISRYDYAR